MPPASVLVVVAVLGVALWGGAEVVKGVKVVDRKVCHFVTAGHKCKPKPAPVPAPQTEPSHAETH